MLDHWLCMLYMLIVIINISPTVYFRETGKPVPLVFTWRHTCYGLLERKLSVLTLRRACVDGLFYFHAGAQCISSKCFPGGPTVSVEVPLGDTVLK